MAARATFTVLPIWEDGLMSDRHIRAVQRLLNDLMAPARRLDINGRLDSRTREMLASWQLREHVTPANGQLNRETWRSFGNYFGTRLNMENVLAYGRNVANFAHGGTLPLRRYDRTTLFTEFMENFHNLPGGHVLDRDSMRGLDQLLHFIEEDPEVTQQRWAAYMVATVMNENSTFVPINEIGCDEHGCTPRAGTQREAYGRPLACPREIRHHQTHAPLTLVTRCPAGKATHQYYGRGYIQITWPEAYALHSPGVGVDLLHFPERALEPGVAYGILKNWLVRGVGWNNHGLPEYVNDAMGAGTARAGYRRARRLVAGAHVDSNERVRLSATRIAGWADTIDGILVNSLLALDPG
jgi:hypothetical protein